VHKLNEIVQNFRNLIDAASPVLLNNIGIMRKFALVVMITIILSCNKSEMSPQELSKPKIEIYYPKTGEAYATGQQFCLKAVISDKSQLEKIQLKIIRVSDNTELKNDEYFITDRVYILDKKFPVTNEMSGNFKLFLEAQNLSGKIESILLDFSVN
jgi:hypothetical protein